MEEKPDYGKLDMDKALTTHEISNRISNILPNFLFGEDPVTGELTIETGMFPVKDTNKISGILQGIQDLYAPIKDGFDK